MLKVALQEGQEAIKYLHVNNIEVISQQAIAMTWPKLCSHYSEFARIFMAAKYLNLNIPERTHNKSLKYLKDIAKCRFQQELPENAILVTKENIIDIMALVAKDLPAEKLHRFSHQVSSASKDTVIWSRDNPRDRTLSALTERMKKTKGMVNKTKVKGSQPRQKTGNRSHHTIVKCCISGHSPRCQKALKGSYWKGRAAPKRHSSSRDHYEDRQETTKGNLTQK